MKEIKVTTLNDAEYFLDNLSTMDELKQIVVKKFTDYMKSNPMELAKGLRDFGEIDELQYKEMVNKIRKADVEKDFKPKESWEE